MPNSLASAALDMSPDADLILKLNAMLGRPHRKGRAYNVEGHPTKGVNTIHGANRAGSIPSVRSVSMPMFRISEQPQRGR